MNRKKRQVLVKSRSSDSIIHRTVRSRGLKTRLAPGLKMTALTKVRSNPGNVLRPRKKVQLDIFDGSDSDTANGDSDEYEDESDGGIADIHEGEEEGSTVKPKEKESVDLKENSNSESLRKSTGEFSTATSTTLSIHANTERAAGRRPSILIPKPAQKPNLEPLPPPSPPLTSFSPVAAHLERLRQDSLEGSSDSASDSSEGLSSTDDDDIEDNAPAIRLPKALASRLREKLKKQRDLAQASRGSSKIGSGLNLLEFTHTEADKQSTFYTLEGAKKPDHSPRLGNGSVGLTINNSIDTPAIDYGGKYVNVRKLNDELYFDYYAQRNFANPLVKSLRGMHEYEKTSEDTFSTSVDIYKDNASTTLSISQLQSLHLQSLTNELRHLYLLPNDGNAGKPPKKDKLLMYSVEAELLEDERPKGRRKANLGKILYKDPENFKLLNRVFEEQLAKYKRENLILEKLYKQQLHNNNPSFSANTPPLSTSQTMALRIMGGRRNLVGARTYQGSANQLLQPLTKAQHQQMLKEKEAKQAQEQRLERERLDREREVKPRVQQYAHLFQES